MCGNRAASVYLSQEAKFVLPPLSQLLRTPQEEAVASTRSSASPNNFIIWDQVFEMQHIQKTTTRQCS